MNLLENKSSSSVNSNKDTYTAIINIKNLVKTYKIKEGEFNALNKINMKV